MSEPGFCALVAGDFTAWMNLWGQGVTSRGARRRVALRLLYNYSGLRATLLFRLSHALWRHRVPALPGIAARLNLTLYGLDIPPSVVIGPGLYIPHPVGTVVMAERIGANVSLISGVTLGIRDSWRSPTLEDGVFIGAGARVLGGVTVGAGASVGANAVVLKDVPPGATAVGVPAKILPPNDARPLSSRERGGTPHDAGEQAELPEHDRTQ